jgi:multidrug efflux system membrane fusion protein
MSVTWPRNALAVPLRLAAVLLVAASFTACGDNRAESKQAPKKTAIPVAAAPVEQKTMLLQLQAIGTVEALSTVSVRAQVGGELMRVHISEGQDVKKGEVLFTIDPRTFEAALAQAQANLARDLGQVQQARAVLERDNARIAQTRAALARDQAQSRNAEVSAQRYEDLFKRELIAREQYDQFRTTAEALAATVRADEADVKSAEETVRADEAAVRAAEQLVRADEAAVETARIQLGYTTIRSPIDGRAGSLVLTAGNVVRAGGTTDSTLIVLNQVRPIYVSFTVPQQQLPAIRRYMAEGELTVNAVPAGETRPVTGTVTFVDNVVDATTGTIRLKGTFANKEGKLWPGQFANVTLTLATESDAIVVPSAAVQTGQQGPYVYVVKADSTVELRLVTPARTQGSETVVAKGVTPGERVVVDGQPRLTAGAAVEVRAAERRGGGAGKGAGGGEGKGDEGKAGDDGKAKRSEDGKAAGAGEGKAGGEGKAIGEGKSRRSEDAKGAGGDGKVGDEGKAKRSEDGKAPAGEGTGAREGKGKAGDEGKAARAGKERP